MRRIVKQQLMESLLNIEATLRDMTRAADKQAALEICAQRMKTIIQTLTQAGSGGGMMAMKLRRFDQSLSRAMDFVDQPDVFAGEAATLAEQFTLIRSKVDKIQPKLEIVFLPYKASMWDSMESIWRAAVADKTCNAHVMPIPYYDLNVDLTIAKYYDESSLFPADVPITDYRGYDLAKNRPDIIYFHNPYDGENLVTSVLPEFYSDKLKQYTDLLVYVPYFVEFGELTQTLAQKPGCANADLIIAHSEANKKSYMEYYPEEKIAVLGAPQIDKVLRTHEHRPEFPEEWRRIAKGRKLILYNMSLISLMRKDGSACRKLRYVFSCFSGRQDVCLLWRPHPLSVATMNSMNERVLVEYQELIKVYREKKLGIYDDSPDVHRAIELSDAYYGDWSSLVPMYEATGKPVMMQDMSIIKLENLDEEESRSLSFSNYLIDGKWVWFTENYFNGLFQMDLETSEIFFIGSFPNESWDTVCMYSKIVKFQDKLFFVPLSSRYIVEFDLETLKFSSYEVFPAGTENGQHVQFAGGALKEVWLYMIPLVGKDVVKFNMITKKIEYYDDWYEKLRPFIKNKNEHLFASVTQNGEEIWCVFRQANIVVKFRMPSMDMKIYTVGEPQNVYFTLTCEGEIFWLIPKSGDRIVRWNSNTHETKEYKKFPSNVSQKPLSMYYCISCERVVWIFPCVGDKILQLDESTGIIKEYKQYPTGFKYLKKLYKFKFGSFQKKNNTIIAFPMQGNMMLQIDGATGATSGKKVLFPKEDFERLGKGVAFAMRGCNKAKNTASYIYKEDRNHYALLNYVCFNGNEPASKKKVLIESSAHMEELCGEKIYQYSKELYASKELLNAWKCRVKEIQN